jgi:para-nitrobenzyl esterase
MVAFRRAPFLVAAFWTAVTFAQPVAPVTLSSGRITGTDLGTVQSWLGIPYAAPPTGALRWKPPQSPVSWEGVRAMDHYGAVCMQSRPAAGTTASEDCLTLNVWAPKGVQRAAVMLWIHGGAFIEGSGALPVYAGTEMARQGVIVVTINYRLGDFGFFAHPALSKESGAEPATNFGFQDQIAALRWVRQNIAAFGGDPQNVTIFGESAGGSSVNYLMISPPARGLFQKAIAESGGGQSHTQKLAELETEGAQRVQSWGAADLAAMRALPAEIILKNPRRVTLAGIGPVVDGKFVLEDPAHGFQEGKQAPVPFLLGANSYEASLMPLFGITADGMMAGLLGNGEKIRQFYGDDPQKAAQALFTDFVFLAPARYLAAQMEKVKQPAYLYFFSYKMERLRAQAPGAPHGGEVPFVFDQFPGALAALATAEDRKVAATVTAAWAQFAKTGNPNRDGAPEWPAYTASADRLLEWGSPIAVRDHFRAEQLDMLTLVSLMRPKF